MTFLIVITPLIIILIIRMIITSSDKKNKKINDAAMTEFWNREREAMFARNQDISGLQLFTPDISALPFVTSSDDKKLLELEQKVRQSCLEPMLDLHEYTNTDLKIKYGNGNFPVISKYDQNFMYFTRDVFQLGKYLYENNYTDESRSVLEYLISISTEVGSAYTILANIYRQSQEPEKISGLIQMVQASPDSISKETILRSLSDIINSY